MGRVLGSTSLQMVRMKVNLNQTTGLFICKFSLAD
uniref:Uncharacterized protein n=1 Tax=Arundo donax TaxID=35708 RepID=A0A0A9GUE8_ARUDO